MSYHCSISAINIPPSRGRRKFFRGPARKIASVPWRSMSELDRLYGPFLGEWKLSTNQRGTLQGLPHISGILVARKKSIGLLWRDDGTFMEFHAGNFIGDLEEEEES